MLVAIAKSTFSELATCVFSRSISFFLRDQTVRVGVDAFEHFVSSLICMRRLFFECHLSVAVGVQFCKATLASLSLLLIACHRKLLKAQRSAAIGVGYRKTLSTGRVKLLTADGAITIQIGLFH
ncbi:MAG: hypothetical protein AAGA24_04605, partial [Pseudomonadota bacterium]